MITWEMVCAFLELLPGAVQDPPESREVVRVKGKPIAYPAMSARSRPDGYGDEETFLIVRCEYSERAALLADDPATFFVTPHYETYPGVIVRLATVPAAQLEELLFDAWRAAAPKRDVRAVDERLAAGWSPHLGQR